MDRDLWNIEEVVLGKPYQNTICSVPEGIFYLTINGMSIEGTESLSNNILNSDLVVLILFVSSIRDVFFFFLLI